MTLRLRRTINRNVDRVSRLLFYLILIGVFVFLLVPLSMVLAMSFDARDFLGSFPPRSFSIRWYEQFFNEPYYIKGLKTSLILAFLTMVISTGLGVSAAIGISLLSPQPKLFFTTLFLSPLVFPGVVIGFALLLFFSFSNIENTFLRLLCAHVLITFPYSVRTVTAAIEGLRPSYVEAALSLGATERKAFWSVTAPLIRTGIVAGAIFAFVFSFDDVAASIFLTDAHTYTLPVALLNMMFANFDLVLAAACVLQIALTVALMLLLDATMGLNTVIGTTTHAR